MMATCKCMLQKGRNKKHRKGSVSHIILDFDWRSFSNSQEMPNQCRINLIQGKHGYIR
jgi:hypothetical protein